MLRSRAHHDLPRKCSCIDLKVTVLSHIFLLQGLSNFDEILKEADGIILARGNLGIDLPIEKVRIEILIQ